MLPEHYPNVAAHRLFLFHMPVLARETVLWQLVSLGAEGAFPAANIL